MVEGQKTKEELLFILLDTFRRLGYEGASLSAISQDTGLGKSSLYHYFPGGKEEMAREVMTHLSGWLDRELLAPLRAPGPPSRRIAAMLEGVDAFYQSGRTPCIIPGLTTGDARPMFQTPIRDLLTAWIEALSGVLIEAGLSRRKAHERAVDAIASIEGSLIVAAGLDDQAPFQRTLARLKATLLVV